MARDPARWRSRAPEAIASSAQESRTAAAGVLNAALQVSNHAERLGTAVHGFLERIRAA